MSSLLSPKSFEKQKGLSCVNGKSLHFVRVGAFQAPLLSSKQMKSATKALITGDALNLIPGCQVHLLALHLFSPLCILVQQVQIPAGYFGVTVTLFSETLCSCCWEQFYCCGRRCDQEGRKKQAKHNVTLLNES